MHCIMKWLQTNQDNSCCMCRRPWEFQDKDQPLDQGDDED